MASSVVPAFQRLTAFLDNRLQALQILSDSVFVPGSEQQQLQSNNGAVSKTRSRTVAGVTSRSQPGKCPYCAQRHHASGCSRYLQGNISMRWELVKSKKLFAQSAPRQVAVEPVLRNITRLCIRKRSNRTRTNSARIEQSTLS